MAFPVGVTAGLGFLALGALVGVVVVTTGRRQAYVLPYCCWSVAAGVWGGTFWGRSHWWAAFFIAIVVVNGVLSGLVARAVREPEAPRRWACPCGEWHELSKGAEEIIRDHGPYVLIPRGDETYAVPRVWIAARHDHSDIPALARQYGWAWMRVEYHLGGE